MKVDAKINLEQDSLMHLVYCGDKKCSLKCAC